MYIIFLFRLFIDGKFVPAALGVIWINYFLHHTLFVKGQIETLNPSTGTPLAAVCDLFLARALV